MKVFIIAFAAGLMAVSSLAQPTPRLAITAFSIEGNNLHFNVFSESISSTTYIVESSPNLHQWTPVLTNLLSQTSFTLPYDSSGLPRHFRLRTPFGTVIFHNRNFSVPNADGRINVPIHGVTDVQSARAQLYLVSGSGAGTTYTPLTPLQTFRPWPNEEFFVAPLIVEVTGKAPGTTGLQFVVRVWEGADTWEAATVRGSSNLITIHAPLGGTASQGAVIFAPPDLGGRDGLRFVF